MRNPIQRIYLGLICSLLLSASSAGAAEFYVSVAGNDAQAGTEQEPFRTVARAKAEVRKKIVEGLQEPVTVLLREGTYELPETLTFGPEDSGTEEFAIEYVAFPGETVVLSGGRRISNWKEAAGGRWTAELPEVKAGKWFFRQLVVNDRRAERARWPNEEGILHVREVTDGVTHFTFDQPLLDEDLGGQDAEMVVYQNWAVTRGLVTKSDAKQLTTATPMGWIGHGASLETSPGKAAYLEHARALLDKPGEWFLDRAAGVLHYLPREGEDSGEAAVVAPVLRRLIAITGTPSQPVRNLRFRGIHIEHVDFPLPAIGYNEIQACHYGTTLEAATHVHPVAVECVYAEGCRFERCRFAHLNSSAVGFGAGCRKNTVVGCLIEDIGGIGVMVGWRGVGKLKEGLERTLDADWANPADIPVGNEVSQCHIRRCGVDSAGAPGIFVAFSADTRIVHNRVHDLPYTGLSIGYAWNTHPTSQARCLVEHNHIFDVMEKLADGGAIYTLGHQPGTVLRHNRIHDVHRSDYAHGGSGNNGIFADEGSSSIVYRNNVISNTSGRPIRFHGGTSGLNVEATANILVPNGEQSAGMLTPPYDKPIFFRKGSESVTKQVRWHDNIVLRPEDWEQQRERLLEGRLFGPVAPWREQLGLAE